MKPYEIWEGDHHKWVSSWNELWDAVQECDRLNNKFNRGYFVKRNNPDGTESRLRREIQTPLLDRVQPVNGSGS